MGMLILTCSMVDMVLDMVDMVDTMDMALDMDMDIILDSTERGLLMLSPRLMLILTCSMVDMVDIVDMADMVDTMDMALDMDMDITLVSKFPHCTTCFLLNDNHTSIGRYETRQDLSVNQQKKWIVSV